MTATNRDLTQLNEHITKIAEPYGLVATAEVFEAVASGTSTAGPHLRVTVSNPAKSPRLEISGVYTIRQLERDGVHAFDVFVRKACTDLSSH